MTPITTHFTLERHYKTGAEALWTLLTDPDARSGWSAPSEAHVLELDKADLREGGEDVHRCGPAEAPEYTVATRWYRLDAPTSATFTETLVFEGARASVALVTYTLAGRETGVDLGVDLSVTSFIGPDLFDEYRAGWEQALTNLEAMAARKPAESH